MTLSDRGAILTGTQDVVVEALETLTIGFEVFMVRGEPPSLFFILSNKDSRDEGGWGQHDTECKFRSKARFMVYMFLTPSPPH